MNLNELQTLRIKELSDLAHNLSVNGGISGLNKQELIIKILEAQAEKEGTIFARGVLLKLNDLG